MTQPPSLRTTGTESSTVVRNILIKNVTMTQPPSVRTSIESSIVVRNTRIGNDSSNITLPSITVKANATMTQPPSVRTTGIESSSVVRNTRIKTDTMTQPPSLRTTGTESSTVVRNTLIKNDSSNITLPSITVKSNETSSSHEVSWWKLLSLLCVVAVILFWMLMVGHLLICRILHVACHLS
ncbi:Hypothetical predicted protein [Paramuricea clavata]|nr:Hypothetical predicted protein [Paramuricea clavata]